MGAAPVTSMGCPACQGSGWPQLCLVFGWETSLHSGDLPHCPAPLPGSSHPGLLRGSLLLVCWAARMARWGGEGGFLIHPKGRRVPLNRGFLLSPPAFLFLGFRSQDKPSAPLIPTLPSAPVCRGAFLPNLICLLQPRLTPLRPRLPLLPAPAGQAVVSSPLPSPPPFPSLLLPLCSPPACESPPPSCLPSLLPSSSLSPHPPFPPPVFLGPSPPPPHLLGSEES